jgi:hypothetical protein
LLFQNNKVIVYFNNNLKSEKYFSEASKLLNFINSEPIALFMPLKQINHIGKKKQKAPLLRQLVQFFFSLILNYFLCLLAPQKSVRPE